jgi:hypothetical protein
MNEGQPELDTETLRQRMDDSATALKRAAEVSERIEQTLKRSRIVRSIAVPALIRAGLIHPDTPQDK